MPARLPYAIAARGGWGPADRMDRLAQGFIPPSRIDLAREADFSLGELRIRPARREVEAAGARLALQRRVMQVLVALARSTTEVVSQHELILRCWGGLTVSDDAIGRCIAQLRRLAAALPEPPFEIETIAGVGYRLTPSIGAYVLRPLPKPSPMPSIAVMPFTSLSSGAGRDYLTDGIVEEIVASLSRFKMIHVISAGGMVVSDGQNLSPREAARQLGVDYFLEGSVRREGERVRVTVHVIDASSGAELWADRFDDVLSDVFALQDRVAERVAGAVEPVLQEAEIQTASRRPTSNLDSYDLYLRSFPPFRLSQKAPMLEAIEYLERAIGLDAQFSWALSQSGICHRQVVDHGWSNDLDLFRSRGLDYAERALVAAPDDAKTVVRAAAALPGLNGDFERARMLADRAIALNPSSTFVWLCSGSMRLRLGDYAVASDQLETALRLDPISPMGAFARMYLAHARFEQRRFHEALALFGTTTHRLPVSHAILAATYGHLGRPEAARQALTIFESLDAGTIDKFARLWFPDADCRDLFLDGVAVAERAG